MGLVEKSKFTNSLVENFPDISMADINRMFAMGFFPDKRGAMDSDGTRYYDDDFAQGTLGRKAIEFYKSIENNFITPVELANQATAAGINISASALVKMATEGRSTEDVDRDGLQLNRSEFGLPFLSLRHFLDNPDISSEAVLFPNDIPLSELTAACLAYEESLEEEIIDDLGEADEEADAEESEEQRRKTPDDEEEPEEEEEEDERPSKKKKSQGYTEPTTEEGDIYWDVEDSVQSGSGPRVDDYTADDYRESAPVESGHKEEVVTEYADLDAEDFGRSRSGASLDYDYTDDRYDDSLEKGTEAFEFESRDFGSKDAGSDFDEVMFGGSPEAGNFSDDRIQQVSLDDVDLYDGDGYKGLELDALVGDVDAARVAVAGSIVAAATEGTLSYEGIEDVIKFSVENGEKIDLPLKDGSVVSIIPSEDGAYKIVQDMPSFNAEGGKDYGVGEDRVLFNSATGEGSHEAFAEAYRLGNGLDHIEQRATSPEAIAQQEKVLFAIGAVDIGKYTIPEDKVAAAGQGASFEEIRRMQVEYAQSNASSGNRNYGSEVPTGTGEQHHSERHDNSAPRSYGSSITQKDSTIGDGWRETLGNPTAPVGAGTEPGHTGGRAVVIPEGVSVINPRIAQAMGKEQTIHTESGTRTVLDFQRESLAGAMTNLARGELPPSRMTGSTAFGDGAMNTAKAMQYQVEEIREARFPERIIIDSNGNVFNSKTGTSVPLSEAVSDKGSFSFEQRRVLSEIGSGGFSGFVNQFTGNEGSTGTGSQHLEQGGATVLNEGMQAEARVQTAVAEPPAKINDYGVMITRGGDTMVFNAEDKRMVGIRPFGGSKIEFIPEDGHSITPKGKDDITAPRDPSGRTGLTYSSVINPFANRRMQFEKSEAMPVGQIKYKTVVGSDGAPTRVPYTTVDSEFIKNRTAAHQDAAEKKNWAFRNDAAGVSSVLASKYDMAYIKSLTPEKRREYLKEAKKAERSMSREDLKQALGYSHHKGISVMTPDRVFRMNGITIQMLNAYGKGPIAATAFGSALEVFTGYASPGYEIKSAWDRNFNNRTKHTKDLAKAVLNEQMKISNPGTFKNMSGKKWTEYKGGIRQASKDAFGKDLTKYSAAALREILKTGVFKGQFLTEEQRLVISNALLMKGVSSGSLKGVDITELLNRSGYKISGQFDLDKSKDRKLLLKQMGKELEAAKMETMKFGFDAKDLKNIRSIKNELSKTNKEIEKTRTAIFRVDDGIRKAERTIRKFQEDNKAISAKAAEKIKKGNLNAQTMKLLNGQTELTKLSKNQLSRIANSGNKIDKDVKEAAKAILAGRKGVSAQLEQISKLKAIKKDLESTLTKLEKVKEKLEGLLKMSILYKLVQNFHKSKEKEKSKVGFTERFRDSMRHLLVGTYFIEGMTVFRTVRQYSKIAVDMVKETLKVLKHSLKTKISIINMIRGKMGKPALGHKFIAARAERRGRKADAAKKKAENKQTKKDNKQKAKAEKKANKNKELAKRNPKKAQRKARTRERNSKIRNGAGNIKAKAASAKKGFGKVGAVLQTIRSVGSSIFNFVNNPFAVVTALGKDLLKKLLLKIAPYALAGLGIVMGILFMLNIAAGVINMLDSSALGKLLEPDPTIDELLVEGNLCQDRIDFCTQMDAAMKMYLEGIPMTKDAIEDFTNYKPVADEYSAEGWVNLDPGLLDDIKNLFAAKGETVNLDKLLNIGSTIYYGTDQNGDGAINEGDIDDKDIAPAVQTFNTGIYFSYFDGDGNEIGIKSNAKDIMSTANSWMKESTAKGLFKSYVEKLWNFSHIVSYNPKKVPTGDKFIYSCGAGKDTKCYHDNIHDYKCNDSSDTMYKKKTDKNGNVIYDKDGKETYELVMPVTDNDKDGILESDRVCSDEWSDLKQYSEHGCELHDFTYSHGTSGDITSKILNSKANTIEVDFDNKGPSNPDGTHGSVKIYNASTGCSDVGKITYKELVDKNGNPTSPENKNAVKTADRTVYYCKGEDADSSNKCNEKKTQTVQIKINEANYHFPISNTHIKNQCSNYRECKEVPGTKLTCDHVKYCSSSSCSHKSSYCPSCYTAKFTDVHSAYYYVYYSRNSIEHCLGKSGSGCPAPSKVTVTQTEETWTYHNGGNFSTSRCCSNAYSYQYTDTVNSWVSDCINEQHYCNVYDSDGNFIYTEWWACSNWDGSKCTTGCPVHRISKTLYYCGGYWDVDETTLTYYQCNCGGKCLGHCLGHCNGHYAPKDETISLYYCDGYCPGHTIHYCTGHVDMQVNCVTLYLNNKNSLLNLGVFRNVKMTQDSQDLTNYLMQKLEGENDTVTQYYTTAKPLDKSKNEFPAYDKDKVSVSSYIEATLYKPIVKFQDLLPPGSGGDDAGFWSFRLPDIDAQDLGGKRIWGIGDGDADNKLNMTRIDNIGTSYSTMKFFAEDVNQWASSKDNSGHVVKNLDDLLALYFGNFDANVYTWIDYNDAVSSDAKAGELTEWINNTFKSMTKGGQDFFTYAPSIGHIHGLYQKFNSGTLAKLFPKATGKFNVFEGWYEYTSTDWNEKWGDKVQDTGEEPDEYNASISKLSGGKTNEYGSAYQTTTTFEKAFNLYEDDWLVTYKIVFPGTNQDYLRDFEIKALRQGAIDNCPYTNLKLPAYSAIRTYYIQTGELSMPADPSGESGSTITFINAASPEGKYLKAANEIIKLLPYQTTTKDGKAGEEKIPFGKNSGWSNEQYSFEFVKKIWSSAGLGALVADGSTPDVSSIRMNTHTHSFYGGTNACDNFNTFGTEAMKSSYSSTCQCKYCTVARLSAGDLIGYGDEVYVVLYNDCLQPDKTEDDPHKVYGVLKGNIVCATVSGGGNPRLITLSAESLAKPIEGRAWVREHTAF